MAKGLVSQAKRSQRLVDASYPCGFASLERTIGRNTESLWHLRPEHTQKAPSDLRDLLT